MFDFGNGNIELRAQPILQSADHHPLVLERLRVGNVDVESQQRDDSRTMLHPTSRRRGHHFFRDERFDGVSDLDVVVVLDADTAFVSALPLRKHRP